MPTLFPRVSRLSEHSAERIVTRSVSEGDLMPTQCPRGATLAYASGYGAGPMTAKLKCNSACRE